MVSLSLWRFYVSINSIHVAEDETNLYRHASRNAQEALAEAKRKAARFDKQTALERKTNEALKLAKAQAHIRDDESTTPSAPSATPLVDCTCTEASSSVDKWLICLI